MRLSNTYIYKQKGTLLITAIFFIALIMVAMMGLFSFLSTQQRYTHRRIEYYKAYYGAEAGINYAAAILSSLSQIPTDGSIFPSDYFKDVHTPYKILKINNELTVYLTFQKIDNSPQSPDKWEVTSTAAYKSSLFNAIIKSTVSLLVQEETFAYYEDFALNFQDLQNENKFSFYGANSIIDGPIHYNTGFTTFGDVIFEGDVSYYSPLNIFSFDTAKRLKKFDFLSLKKETNIINYQENSARFCKGLKKIKNPIRLPSLNSSDLKFHKLFNAKKFLELPRDDRFYTNTSTLPQYSIQLADDSNDINDDGYIVVKQYLGKDKNTGTPLFSPSTTVKINDVSNLVIVNGNIVSLEGVLDGKLTIVARNMSSKQGESGGNVYITDSLFYESKQKLSASSNSPLYGVLDDMLGIIAERNVLIAEKNLEGKFVGADEEQIEIDGFIITGASSNLDSGNEGYFSAEKYDSRKTGSLLFFGGRAGGRVGMFYKTNEEGDQISGLLPTVQWDSRGAFSPPPYFPTTGNLIFSAKRNI